MCQVQNSRIYLEKQQESVPTSPFIQYHSNVLLLIGVCVSLGQKLSLRHLLPSCSCKVCKNHKKRNILFPENGTCPY